MCRKARILILFIKNSVEKRNTNQIVEKRRHFHIPNCWKMIIIVIKKKATIWHSFVCVEAKRLIAICHKIELIHQ